MGTITFTGDPPYVLEAMKGGKATASGESVKLTLTVCVPAPGPEQREREIDVLFLYGRAFGTASELQKAANEARKQARSEGE